MRCRNSFDSRLAPPRPRPEPAAGGVAVAQRQLDVRDAGALVLERQPQAARGRRSAPRCARAAAAVVEVLRASSLAAVTILVWSTRLKPSSTARSRTTWRTRTTSSRARGRQRLSSEHRRQLRPGEGVAAASPKQRHAALDVERGPHARQRQPELDQRDRHRRRMPTTTVCGVEDARHRRDVAEHAADEGVDDLERRDVDQHAARAGRRRCASVRSSCSVIASRSCMSTWIVTSRNSPIFRIGMRSMASDARRVAAPMPWRTATRAT